MLFKSATKVLGATAAAALLAVSLSATAHAGECPANQVMAGALKGGETMAKGVTDTVLASIDLSSKGAEWKGQMFRLRRLVVEAGGIVPWHEHGVRPANIYIIDGSITEYRSDCRVPIEHKSGEVTAEFGSLAHWWKNNTGKPVVLISADILPPAKAADHTM